MFNKIFIGALAVLAMACAGLFWYGQSKAEEAATWKQAHSDMQVINAEWQDRLEKKKAELRRVAVLSTEREKRRAALAKQAAGLRQQLRSLSRLDQDVENYLERPVPAGLLERLQLHAAAKNGTGDGEAVPAKPLALELPNPGDQRQPD